MPETPQAPPNSEFVLALVAAVGTDVGMVADEFSTQLTAFSYTSSPIRLSDFLAEDADASFRELPFDEELWEAMSAGDTLRERSDRNDILALKAITTIAGIRDEEQPRRVPTGPDTDEPANLERRAFILRSLKTPDELETLRLVYRERLVVIGAYSPHDTRVAHLAQRIRSSRNQPEQADWKHQPEALIDRDEKEERLGGQDVSGTFHRADFFIRAWDRDVAQTDIDRTLRILFGDPFRTPTRDEHAQFIAAGASLRSAEMGRQVGAVIATTGGSVVAVGTNEVPKYGGGSHWEEEDGSGNRDFEVSEIDTNRKHLDELSEQIATTVVERVRELTADIEDPPPPVSRLIESLEETLVRDVRSAGLKDITEFGRAVHAEMNALLDAARRGVTVAGATLYSTTFPCHNCARHIIGAGIERVVFIEPYPKSRAIQLHEDSAVLDDDGSHRVAFQPFFGVAPRRYLQVFDAEARSAFGHVERKDTSGARQELDCSTALPVFVERSLGQFRPELPDYRMNEILALAHFDLRSGGGAERSS